MKEFFVDKNFRRPAQIIIAQANQIIDEYSAAGFTLTLRQLYYQFVARGLLPNKQASYDKLGSIINDARLAGLVDWSAIEDRTRNVRRNAHWDSPKDGIEALRSQYAIDMWENQPYRVEVWIEKEALVGVIEDVCIELDVPFFACRGYVSQSEQWRAWHRFDSYWAEGQANIILHLGDHDPSGIHMTEDNQRRFNTFANGSPDYDTDIVRVVRIALNMDQIQQHNPPPNPAKVNDPRFDSYLRKHGHESWELDALDPPIIEQLIRDHVDNYRDAKLWAQTEAKLVNDEDTLDRIIAGLPG